MAGRRPTEIEAGIDLTSSRIKKLLTILFAQIMEDLSAQSTVIDLEEDAISVNESSLQLATSDPQPHKLLVGQQDMVQDLVTREASRNLGPITRYAK